MLAYLLPPTSYLLLPLTCFCPGEEALSEYLAEGQAVWGPGGGGKEAPGDEQHQDADVTAEDEGSVAEMGASVAKDVMAEIFQDEVEDDRPDDSDRDHDHAGQVEMCGRENEGEGAVGRYWLQVNCTGHYCTTLHCTTVHPTSLCCIP